MFLTKIHAWVFFIMSFAGMLKSGYAAVVYIIQDPEILVVSAHVFWFLAFFLAVILCFRAFRTCRAETSEMKGYKASNLYIFLIHTLVFFVVLWLALRSEDSVMGWIIYTMYNFIVDAAVIPVNLLIQTIGVYVFGRGWTDEPYLAFWIANFLMGGLYYAYIPSLIRLSVAHRNGEQAGGHQPPACPESRLDR